jgi:sugar phosphate isomerase/epimerase
MCSRCSTALCLPEEHNDEETRTMLPNNDISYQLWSSAKVADPLDIQLAALKSLGYTDVQPFQKQYDDPGETRRLLEAHGLTAKSGHFDFAMIENEFDRVLDIAHTLGMKLVVAPYLQPAERPMDANGWKRWGALLQGQARRCEAAGLGYAWHNHDFEFQALPDGAYPIEYLLGDEVAFEIDVAWVVRAGADPKRWIERFSGRIPAVHVKDIASGEDVDKEDGWADVGYGIVDWQTLWDLAVSAGSQLMIVEHDAPRDYVRSARRSIETIKRLAGV